MRFRGVVREYEGVLGTLMRALDLCLIMSAGALAALAYLGEVPDTPKSYWLAISIGALLCLSLFPNFGIYRGWRGDSLGKELRAITIALAISFSAMTAITFAIKSGQDFSRIWFIAWGATSWLFLAISRVVLRRTLRELRRRGWNQRRIIILGSAHSVEALSNGLISAPWTGLVIRQVLTLDEFTSGIADDDAFLVKLVRNLAIDEVWVALPIRHEAAIQSIQKALRYSTVDLRYVPDISSLQLLNHSIAEVAGFPVINLTSSGMSESDLLLKTIEDRLLAAIGLCLVSPLLLVIAAGVRLSSPGPILFRQKRWGLNGGEITVLKFRTMRLEASLDVKQATRADPRVTPFGRFLRQTSLDELPQLVNVLKGDMSIVGPRPHAVAHNEIYRDLVEKYMSRHKIKPGITGWAQVNGYRGETDTVDKMRRRVEHDLYYIENWSLGLDCKIIVRTIIEVLRDPNAY